LPDVPVVQVPLVAGSNEPQAECRNHGVTQYHAAGQHWFVRLRDAPTARVAMQANESEIELDARATEPAANAPTPIARYDWRERAGNPSALRLPQQGTVSRHLIGSNTELSLCASGAAILA